MSLKITDLKCIKCGSEEQLTDYDISKMYQSQKKSFSAPFITTTTTTLTRSAKVPVCRSCYTKALDLDRTNFKIILINSIITIGAFITLIVGSSIRWLKFLDPLQLILLGIFLLGILVFYINVKRYRKHKANIDSITNFRIRTNKYGEGDWVLAIKPLNSSDWVYFDDWAKNIVEKRYGILETNSMEDQELKTIFCTNCGEKSKSESEFCGNCGFKFPK